MWEHLAHYRIILGSQSPRRVELLRGLDLDFEQHSLPDIDESYPRDSLCRRSPATSPRGRPRPTIPPYMRIPCSSRPTPSSSLRVRCSASLRRRRRQLRCSTASLAEGTTSRPGSLSAPRSTTYPLLIRQRSISFPSHRRRSITTSSATRLWTRRVPMGYRSGSATWPSLASRARSTP